MESTSEMYHVFLLANLPTVEPSTNLSSVERTECTCCMQAPFLLAVVCNVFSLSPPRYAAHGETIVVESVIFDPLNLE